MRKFFVLFILQVQFVMYHMTIGSFLSETRTNRRYQRNDYYAENRFQVENRYI